MVCNGINPIKVINPIQNLGGKKLDPKGRLQKKKTAKLHTWPKKGGGRSFQMQTFF